MEAKKKDGLLKGILIGLSAISLSTGIVGVIVSANANRGTTDLFDEYAYSNKLARLSEDFVGQNDLSVGITGYRLDSADSGYMKIREYDFSIGKTLTTTSAYEDASTIVVKDNLIYAKSTVIRTLMRDEVDEVTKEVTRDVVSDVVTTDYELVYKSTDVFANDAYFRVTTNGQTEAMYHDSVDVFDMLDQFGLALASALETLAPTIYSDDFAHLLDNAPVSDVHYMSAGGFYQASISATKGVNVDGAGSDSLFNLDTFISKKGLTRGSYAILHSSKTDDFIDAQDDLEVKYRPSDDRDMGPGYAFYDEMAALDQSTMGNGCWDLTSFVPRYQSMI